MSSADIRPCLFRACRLLPSLLFSPPSSSLPSSLRFLLRHLKHPEFFFAAQKKPRKKIPRRGRNPSWPDSAGALPAPALPRFATGLGGRVARPIAGVRGSGRWRVGAGVGSVAGGSTGPDRWRRHGQAGWPRASARSAGPGPRGASGPAGRPPETAATATAAGNGRGWPSSGGSSTGSLRIGSSRSPTASMVR